MSKIISIHSFRGGTGKSNIIANVSTLLAASGFRVGVIDTDIQSPGIHVPFGFDEDEMTYALNDYLWGECHISETAYDVTAKQGFAIKGKIFLIPSNIKSSEIARVVREGVDMHLLVDGFHKLVEELKLDTLLIDTHPGLHEETLLSIAVSDALIMLLRPDGQDYQGTAVAVEVARQLDVKRIVMVVNKVPEHFDFNQVQRRVEQAYACPVAAVLPHSDEVMSLGSEGIFALKYPDHPLTEKLRRITTSLLVFE